jgi:hypothetical protein
LRTFILYDDKMIRLPQQESAVKQDVIEGRATDQSIFTL